LNCRVTEDLAQFVVALFFAYPATERFDERQVRCGCFVLVATAAQHDGAIDGGLNREFARETRLARARFAAEQHCVAAPFASDANDVLYQWDSSRDYNATPRLDRIRAKVLAINAADDERNPPELGLLDREIKRIPNGRVLLIPASEVTTRKVCAL